MRGREGAVRLRSECMRGLRRGHLCGHGGQLQLLGLRCRHLQSHGGGELLALCGRQVQLDERVIVHELLPGLSRNLVRCFDLHGMRGGEGGGDGGLDLVQCMRGREGAVRLRSKCMRGLRRGHLGKHTRQLQLLGLRCRHLQSRGGGELLILCSRHIQPHERVIVHELFAGFLHGFRGELDLHGL